MIDRDHNAWPWVDTTKFKGIDDDDLLEFQFSGMAKGSIAKALADRVTATRRGDNVAAKAAKAAKRKMLSKGFAQAITKEAPPAPVADDDELFNGRRGAVVYGQGMISKELNGPYQKLLAASDHPYRFDDLVVSAFSLEAKEEGTLPSGDQVNTLLLFACAGCRLSVSNLFSFTTLTLQLYTPNFLTALRQGNACALNAVREPNYFAGAGAYQG